MDRDSGRVPVANHGLHVLEKYILLQREIGGMNLYNFKIQWTKAVVTRQVSYE
jgi:hypothetical protein